MIVCTRGRATCLDRCLETLSRLRYPNYDVLVVDNAPSDGSAARIAERWNARYVIEPIAGLSRARNRGAQESRSEIIAYLDDDSVPAPDWLDELVTVFQADPTTCAVTGPILSPVPNSSDEDHESPQRPIIDLGSTPIAVDRQTSKWFEISNFGGIGAGGNMAFRRAALDMCRGFDERLGRGAIIGGGEENYAFFCLMDRGYRLAYAPGAIVYHPALDQRAELRDRTNALAYMAFLLVEERRFRSVLFKYVVEALLGRRRQWRLGGSARPTRFAPWWQSAGCYLRAGGMCVQLVRQNFQRNAIRG